jgi:hypothetical protein
MNSRKHGAVTNKIGWSGYFTSLIEGMDSCTRRQKYSTDKMGSRFVTLAGILNMLIDIESAVSCAPLAGFAVFPLPAKKVLWGAPNAAAWKTESDVGLRERWTHEHISCQLRGVVRRDGWVWYLGYDYGLTLVSRCCFVKH